MMRPSKRRLLGLRLSNWLFRSPDLRDLFEEIDALAFDLKQARAVAYNLRGHDPFADKIMDSWDAEEGGGG